VSRCGSAPKEATRKVISGCWHGLILAGAEVFGNDDEVLWYSCNTAWLKTGMGKEDQPWR
jgi:hypothetical protein